MCRKFTVTGRCELCRTAIVYRWTDGKKCSLRCDLSRGKPWRGGGMKSAFAFSHLLWQGDWGFIGAQKSCLIAASKQIPCDLLHWLEYKLDVSPPAKSALVIHPTSVPQKASLHQTSSRNNSGNEQMAWSPRLHSNNRSPAHFKPLLLLLCLWHNPAHYITDFLQKWTCLSTKKKDAVISLPHALRQSKPCQLAKTPPERRVQPTKRDSLHMGVRFAKKNSNQLLVEDKYKHFISWFQSRETLTFHADDCVINC